MSEQLRIAFVNQKGGVGKSTVASLTAAAMKSAGLRVAVDDQDPQGALCYWAKVVGDIPTIAECPEASIVIVDSPGHLDLEDAASRLKFAGIVGSAARIVVVTEKSLLGLRAARVTADLVKEFKVAEAKAHLLFNKVRVGTRTGDQDPADIARQLGLPALKQSLPLRSAYEVFTSLGWKAVTGVEREKVVQIATEIIR